MSPFLSETTLGFKDKAALCFLKMVDHKGIEPLTLACKASIFPIKLTAHLFGTWNRI